MSRTISRENYTVDRAVKELSALLANPSYAARAAAVGRIVNAEDGVSLTCETILSRLATPAKIGS
ncbi:hypothetical protein [Chamaesiphon polymorphus]|uniref:Uncharacterized protein n=1 Tax=Chamaesiphon polymorphus CCALA 037 TaxID=2107692 RepID=A0A2T1GMK6_9CYAN|nr:hypothetical protein [Chamaesiphon polymorphus]PSB59109.1 hypothetical protein C7B77_02225 [Chamaesiphon polymorphus CCALA 037]